MNGTETTAWHAQGAAEAVRVLRVDPARGLPGELAAERLRQYGPNVLTRKKGHGPLVRFLLQFHQPLIYILLAAAAVTAYLQEWVDSSVIFGVVLINAVVGFIQEAKALKSLEALSRTMVAQALVLRDGSEMRVSSEELVPGDIVILASGDKVAADMRLLNVRDLQVNESALTGESAPVEKMSDTVAADEQLAERRNMAYASTLVTYGKAKGVVVATGDASEIGRISKLIQSAQELETPLTRKIARFSHLLLYVILALSFITFLAGVLRGQNAVEMFMAAVALAVSAIPEGLPAAVTIALAIGVSRMAKRQAIIRKLPAVETLGSTTVICSDKTGTLTKNEMTVQTVRTASGTFTVEGAGYAAVGRITAGSALVDVRAVPELYDCLLAGILCNDSKLIERDGMPAVDGDPTEGALIVSALKAGITLERDCAQYPRIDAIPFESQNQYMATLHRSGDNARIYMKGGVEAVLERCSVMAAGGATRALDRDAVHRWAEEMASSGLRVLAFARTDAEGAKNSLEHADLAGNMVFVGLQGMIDPPRPEAIRAIENCHTAGIRVKMITGDHPHTASAIAALMRLNAEDGRVDHSVITLTGKQLAAISDDDLPSAVERTDVFARTTPEQKLQLVRALQTCGHIVAMTGDGVNDAPALKQSDIGVAMGRNGTEVAKESADMVLTDDNFASIEAAVEEGRGVYDNLRKFIIWTLPTNLGEGLSIMAAIFAGFVLPILPVQILWINMTTAVFLGMMLAFEPKEPGIMNRPPYDPRMPIMTRDLIIRTLYVGILLVLAIYGLFLYEQARGATLAEARTVAVTVLIFGELFYLFNCRSLTKSLFNIGLFSNTWAIVGSASMAALQLLFIYAGPMNVFFHSAPISAGAWFRIIAAGLLISLVVAMEKTLRRSLQSSR